MIEGRLWANIWLTDTIAVIDLSTGVVLFYVDCSSLKLQLEGTLGSEYVTPCLSHTSHPPRKREDPLASDESDGIQLNSRTHVPQKDLELPLLI